MHWFLDPIQNQYADFKGRATRQEFWMFVLYTFLFYILGAVAWGVFAAMVPSGFFIGLVILIIAMLALFVPSLTFQVRRLHDTGRSGWWLLLSFIPYIGGLIVLVFECLPSQLGTNIYGPNKYESAVVPTPFPQPIGTEAYIVTPTSETQHTTTVS